MKQQSSHTGCCPLTSTFLFFQWINSHLKKNDFLTLHRCYIQSMNTFELQYKKWKYIIKKIPKSIHIVCLSADTPELNSKICHASVLAKWKSFHISSIKCNFSYLHILHERLLNIMASPSLQQNKAKTISCNADFLNIVYWWNWLWELYHFYLNVWLTSQQFTSINGLFYIPS